MTVDVTAAAVPFCLALATGQALATLAQHLAYGHGRLTPSCVRAATQAIVSLAARRWEALDRSLRRVDAVLNEAARSTGLELDRVCDGSLGMLGGLTQMPPPLEQHHHSAFTDEVPDKVVTNDDDGEAGACTQQAPSSGGVGFASQPDQQSDSPCSSDCEGPGVLTQKPPQPPADSPRSPARKEQSQHDSPSHDVRQASIAPSPDEDATQDSPRHTPREEWTQEDVISISSQEASPRQTPDTDSLLQTSVEVYDVRSPPQPEFALAEAASSSAEQDPEVWFEVSPNTGRVHLHAVADGSEPFGLSVPVRALLARNDPEPLLEELVRAVESRSVTLHACSFAEAPRDCRHWYPGLVIVLLHFFARSLAEAIMASAPRRA